MTAIPLDKIEDILQKGKSLEEQLGKENTSEKFVELSKEYSEIQPLYESVVEWKNIYIEMSDLKNLLEAQTIITNASLNIFLTHCCLLSFRIQTIFFTPAEYAFN